MRVLFVGQGPVKGAAIYGTERVAAGLARRLRCLGIEMHVAGHAAADEPTGRATQQGVHTHVLPSMPRPTRDQYFEMRTPSAPGFRDLLAETRPDIVQLFGLAAPSGNRRHIELAKAAGAKVVLWCNVPGVSCLQRGLLYEAKTPCDGRVMIQRCTYCRLRHVGMPQPVAAIASRLDVGALSRRLPQRAGALFGARRLTAQFKRGFEHAFDQLDAVWVSAQWTSDALRRNDIPAEKLHLIRLGIAVDDEVSDVSPADGFWQHAGADRPARLIYWGRIYEAKGVHTLVEALALRPALPVELAIVGKIESGAGYRDRLQRQVARDKRVRLTGEIPANQISKVLRTADLGIIPSRWHETGPLTVYEARAAGLPIIGSNRGGIGELCVEGQGARLFPADDAAALSTQLADVLQTPGVLESLRNTVPAPRPIEDVAQELHQLYAQLLGAANPGLGSMISSGLSRPRAPS